MTPIFKRARLFDTRAMELHTRAQAMQKALAKVCTPYLLSAPQCSYIHLYLLLFLLHWANSPHLCTLSWMLV